jgi:DNA-binding transcriptional MerR regulator
MRTDELLRRVDGLDAETLAACERAGWVRPATLSAGGSDPRWWSGEDLNRLRDIARLKRGGMPLEAAHAKMSEERFFGLCPCDWRL